MKYFVYYNDDYPDNGGVGMEDFGISEDVATFIEGRLAQDPDKKKKVADYTVIYGRKLTIEPIETAIKIRVNH